MKAQTWRELLLSSNELEALSLYYLQTGTDILDYYRTLDYKYLNTVHLRYWMDQPCPLRVVFPSSGTS